MSICYSVRMRMSAKKTAPKLFSVEFDRELDGRWIAEFPRIPGVMAYGATKREALQRVYAIALRTLADHVDSGKNYLSIARLFEHGMAVR